MTQEFGRDSGLLTIDTVKHEMRKRGPDGEERYPLPPPRILKAIIYLILNRDRAVSLENVWEAVHASLRHFKEPDAYKIISECRIALDPDRRQREKYIILASPRFYRFIHEDVKIIDAGSAATRGDRFMSHFGETSPRRVELPQVDLGVLLDEIRRACPPNERTRNFMQLADIEGLAVDACFEVDKSHEYQGWTEDDFSWKYEPDLALPQDLAEINARNQPEPPNNGKYRIRRWLAGSSERKVAVTLAPTDYFSTRPVLLRMFDPVLVGENGLPCSPAEKYGKNVLDFETCALPSLVCVHVTVLLPGEKLLLSQRVKGSGTDWEGGKWSPSFEEQMASDTKVRDTPDLTFFDTVEAGLDEELGMTCVREDIKIISVVMDTGALVIDPIAIVRVESNIANIRAHWALKAQDGKAELRKLLEVDWSLERLLPVLCGEDLIIGDVTIRREDWLLTARMRILVCMFHTFGIEKTLRALRAYIEQKESS